MKWILLFVMPLVMATNPKIDKDKCTCNGYPLFVDCAPAIRVEFVDCAPDIRVKYVEYSPGIKK